MFERRFSILESLFNDSDEYDAKEFKKEMDKLKRNFTMLSKEFGTIIQNIEFSDTMAHVLRETMIAVDKARGEKKSEKLNWSREEVIDLIAALRGGSSVRKSSQKRGV